MLLSRHQNAGQKDSYQILWKCGTVQIFGDESKGKSVPVRGREGP
jgi:hypothetical protein